MERSCILGVLELEFLYTWVLLVPLCYMWWELAYIKQQLFTARRYMYVTASTGSSCLVWINLLGRQS